MEKSALKTTLAHGPGQPAGGRNVKNLGEKLLKAMLLKSSTTHGTVFGRGIGGSANAVLADPITSPDDGLGFSERTDVVSRKIARIDIPTTDLRRKECRFIFIGPPLVSTLLRAMSLIRQSPTRS